MKKFAITLLIANTFGSMGFADDFLVPTIGGPWIQIAGNPDLGELTGRNQQPVDFAVWQAADGTWQAWSCIRRTKCGGHTRLFHRWEGQSLTQPDWKPKGIAMLANEELGEQLGGLQAPHVVKQGNIFHMFYGDWRHICHAVSKDGKYFERVIQPNGTTGLFEESRQARERGDLVNTRDIMMLDINGLWHGYYTACAARQGGVLCRTTRDFKSWSPSTVVAFGGEAGTGCFSGECPHVIFRNNRYYLFRTQRYGADNSTSIYHSSEPKMFGVNQDERYFATRLPVAAPEVVHHDGQDYIVALNLNLDGLRIAPLRWEAPLKPKTPVFQFSDADQQKQWKREAGDLPGPFSKTKRTPFLPPQEFFIGTAEVDGGDFDDSLTGSIRSPNFNVTDERYIAYIGGGTEESKLYMSIVDSETEQELFRIGSLYRDNRLQPVPVDLRKAIGRDVYVRIVDQARGDWGHFNFGGLYTIE